MKEKIETILGRKVTLVHPKAISNGDYSLIADTASAEEDFNKLQAAALPEFERIEHVKPRFINFYLSKKFFADSLSEIVKKGDEFGKGGHAKGYKVMVEHTDPNPFKEFHIGHLMPNVIGSTIARICAWNGAEVKQANYQGDKGLHVAKAVWAMQKGEPLMSAYAAGNKAFEESEEAKAEITDINKKIYDGSDAELNRVYEEGRKASLAYFEEIYKKLNTAFDFYFFESETAPIGKKIVEENIGKVFEESEGAIVFKGSHTRVFINSQGIPTYEAKDLGNAKNKFDHYPYDLSVVVTGNEIKDYFKVVLEAMTQVLPDLAKKTKHLPHGMLRLPTGKMSSRTGNVITAESLIEEVKKLTKGNEEVAIAAIKYMILRQGIGQDIVFDFEKSVSTEGDSGVYLQYAHARASSVIEKLESNRLFGEFEKEKEKEIIEDVSLLERMLYRFPEIIERAGAEYAPNLLVTYLTEVAAAFNNFYAHNQIINPDNIKESVHRIRLTLATKQVLKNGLTVLGIPAPERM
jgi:arginyl-tRNA synthetase